MEIVNMKKIFVIILFSLLVFNKGYAASGTGEATIYTITMKKVELCEDLACTESFTIGEKNLDANIASVTAGADVAGYAATTGIPIGTTYSHLKVTLDRSFTLKGTVTIGSTTCTTDGDGDSTKTQLAMGTKNDTSVVDSEVMEISTEGGYSASNGGRTGALDSGNFNMDFSDSELSSAKSMTVSGDTALMVYELTAPFTSGIRAPTIKINFNTTEALGADDTNCAMFIQEPTVTITIE